MEKTKGNLDELFFSKLNEENITQVFTKRVEKKTSLTDGDVHFSQGSDSIGYQRFRKNLSKHSALICEKCANGKYLFTPFWEKELPKPPFRDDQLKEAREAGAIRVISTATIQDTVVQELMNQAVQNYVEETFAKYVNDSSFAYRKSKSPMNAISNTRKYMDEGYIYCLNGDIEKFFDKIDHKLMKKKLDILFDGNPVLQKLMYRFLHVGRISAEDIYLQKEREEKGSGDNGRPPRKYPASQRRLCGIPQGGVLSGMFSNIFLLDFDRYVLGTLQKEYDFKYVRYADDFVLLFKEDTYLNEVFQKLIDFLKEEKLTLHPLGGKSKMVDVGSVKRERLEFVGFEVSPRYTRIRKKGVTKFLDAVQGKINECSTDNPTKYVREVIARIAPRLVGLETMMGLDGLCADCGGLLPKRNWVAYYLAVDDVRQLRNIDTKIRQKIYQNYYNKTGKNLPRYCVKLLKNGVNSYNDINLLRKNEITKEEAEQNKKALLSVEKVYYRYKHQVRKVDRGSIPYCHCNYQYDKREQKIKIVKKEEPEAVLENNTVSNI